MTIREWAIGYCTDRGMWAADAAEVVERTARWDVAASLASRWGHDVASYGEPILTAVAIAVRTQAVLWIEENSPDAWFRPLFEASYGARRDN